MIPRLNGTKDGPIHAGVKEFEKVLALIGAGQKICC